MLYLIGQIVFCLLAAGLLGFVIGWLLRGTRQEGGAGAADKSAERIEMLQAALDDCRTSLNRAPARTRAKATVRKVTSSERDDLKRILGIGPVLEKKLNELNVTTYEQIASWREKDINFFAERIGPFRNRIKRDSWIEGAKAQHYLKYKKDL